MIKNKLKIKESQKKTANQIINWLNLYWQPGVFILAHVFIVAVLYRTIYTTPYGSTGLYFTYANEFMQGLVPYRDFSFEYPPLSLLFFILPRLFTSTYVDFAILYTVEIILFDLIALCVIYKVARRLGKAPWKLLWVYTLCFLAMGPIVPMQFDLFPAVLTLLSLYFFWIRKHKLSWAMLALGTLTKVFPGLIAPIYLIIYFKNKQIKEIKSGLITFAVIVLVVLVPLLIVGHESIFALFEYHADRGLQLESVYSAFLLILYKMNLVSVGREFNYGAYHLTGPAADVLKHLSTYIMIAAVLLIYVYIYRQVKPGKSQFTRLGVYSLLVMITMLSTSKILSPQYFIWLLPFFPLLLGEWKYFLIAVYVVLGALTYYIFPIDYLSLISLRTPIVILLFYRDVVMILLALLCFGYLRVMKPSE